MIAMLAHNLNRDVRKVRLFEQGTVFTGSAEVVAESPSLSLGLTGAVPASNLYPPTDAPFFELKGAIELLLRLFDLGGAALTFTAEAPAWLEAGRSATAVLAGKPIACFGELAVTERETRKLRQPVFLAEIDLAALYTLPLRRATAHELSRFQAVERDFSFVFPDTVAWGAVADAIKSLGIPELRSFKPVELWRDQKIYPGVHSMLLRCVFQSNQRTLREDELAQWSSGLIATLVALGAVLRT
jgi:phenylalanyl-tRNA synthetase beta chain